MVKLKERDTTRTVKDFMEYRGWRGVRINAGPFGKKGQPDFLFLRYIAGSLKAAAVWVEFKSPRGRLSTEQTAWIDEERRRGATCIVVRDFDEFVEWYARNVGEEGQMRLRA